MTDVKRRPYRSPQRRARAEATRRAILVSAHRLFVGRGYGGATVEAIAQDAGVAPPTVYAAFGSKRGLLFSLLDRMAEDADLSGLQAALAAAAGDPPRQLRAQIAFNVRFYDAGFDLIDIARTVAGVEPDLGEMWREGEARRHRAQSALAAGWAAAGALAPGLSAGQATDVLWALSGPDLFRLLVVEQKWDLARFESWLGEVLARELFGLSSA